MKKIKRAEVLNSTALHGTEKSGYARKLLPERLTVEERRGLAIPIATIGGRQEGVPTPAERIYGKAHYEPVELTEAIARMQARKAGKLKKIAGGLDDIKAVKQGWKPVTEPVPAADPEIDPDTEVLDTDGDDAFSPGQRDTSGGDFNEPRYPQAVAPQVVKTNPVDVYLKQRKRVTLELSDTTLYLSVIDVVINKYCVVLLLPLNAEGGTFVPRIGSELVITVGDNAMACYYPGSQFELAPLKLLGLSFIRKEEGT